MEANASLRSVKPLDPELISAIEQTAREQLKKLDEQDEEQAPPSKGGSGSGSSIGRPAKTNRQFRSTTDPDASLVRQGGLKSQLRYKTHRAVDDAHEVITAVETTTGAVDEATQLLGLIEAHQDTTAQAVRTVIAGILQRETAVCRSVSKLRPLDDRFASRPGEKIKPEPGDAVKNRRSA